MADRKRQAEEDREREVFRGINFQILSLCAQSDLAIAASPSQTRGAATGRQTQGKGGRTAQTNADVPENVLR